jgi:hypothetical protein
MRALRATRAGRACRQSSQRGLGTGWKKDLPDGNVRAREDPEYSGKDGAVTGMEEYRVGTERSPCKPELDSTGISGSPVTWVAWHDSKSLLLRLALEICISSGHGLGLPLALFLLALS